MLAVCFLAAVQISVRGQGNAENSVDLQVKGISLDSSLARVTRVLGAPKSRKQSKPAFSECSERRETRLTMNYPGAVLKLIGDGKGRNFKVVSVSISSSAWPVANGVAVGSNLRAVESRFGRPLRTENEGGLERLVYFHKDNGGATFYFRADKLVRVEWALDLC